MTLKTFPLVIALVLVVPLSFSLVSGGTPKSDPCSNTTSNAEMRQCYTAAQAKVNAQADSSARELAAEFRKQAQNPILAGGVVPGELLKAASAVSASQKMWKAYRDRHCEAVAYSWTTGSGAGTAQEQCLFRLGQERLEELRTAFN